MLSRNNRNLACDLLFCWLFKCPIPTYVSILVVAWFSILVHFIHCGQRVLVLFFWIYDSSMCLYVIISAILTFVDLASSKRFGVEICWSLSRCYVIFNYHWSSFRCVFCSKKIVLPSGDVLPCVLIFCIQFFWFALFFIFPKYRRIPRR